MGNRYFRRSAALERGLCLIHDQLPTPVWMPLVMEIGDESYATHGITAAALNAIIVRQQTIACAVRVIIEADVTPGYAGKRLNIVRDAR